MVLENLDFLSKNAMFSVAFIRLVHGKLVPYVLPSWKVNIHNVRLVATSFSFVTTIVT